jgi:hypothetical protein
LAHHIMLRLDFSKNEDGHQFEHTIEHLRSVELNLLLHLILQGFYSISHTSTHIKPHISRVLIRTSKTTKGFRNHHGSSRGGRPWEQGRGWGHPLAAEKGRALLAAIFCRTRRGRDTMGFHGCCCYTATGLEDNLVQEQPAMARWRSGHQGRQPWRESPALNQRGGVAGLEEQRVPWLGRQLGEG